MLYGIKQHYWIGAYVVYYCVTWWNGVVHKDQNLQTVSSRLFPILSCITHPGPYASPCSLWAILFPFRHWVHYASCSTTCSHSDPNNYFCPIPHLVYCVSLTASMYYQAPLCITLSHYIITQIITQSPLLTHSASLCPILRNTKPSMPFTDFHCIQLQ